MCRLWSSMKPQRSPRRIENCVREQFGDRSLKNTKNRPRRKSSPRRRLRVASQESGTSSRRWRSVARGYWRSLYTTRLAAASPFHSQLVSPGSRETVLASLSSHVDSCSFADIAGPFRDGHHNGLFARLSRVLRRANRAKSASALRIDKPGRPFENRNFRFFQRMARP